MQKPRFGGAFFWCHRDAILTSILPDEPKNLSTGRSLPMLMRYTRLRAEDLVGRLG